jgi:hypothetical protein
MSMRLASLLTCLAFFDLLWTEQVIQTPEYGSCFFPKRLSNYYQGLYGNSSYICAKFDAHSLPNPYRNHIRPSTRLLMKGHNKSVRLPSCMKFCTLTPKICYYYNLSLHRPTTITVQVATRIPKVMDTPSYVLLLKPLFLKPCPETKRTWCSFQTLKTSCRLWSQLIVSSYVISRFRALRIVLGPTGYLLFCHLSSSEHWSTLASLLQSADCTKQFSVVSTSLVTYIQKLISGNLYAHPPVWVLLALWTYIWNPSFGQRILFNVQQAVEIALLSHSHITKFSLDNVHKQISLANEKLGSLRKQRCKENVWKLRIPLRITSLSICLTASCSSIDEIYQNYHKY